MEITNKVIESYLRRAKRGEKTLSLLGKLYPFIHSILETEIGKELLQDDILRHDELFLKVYQEKATVQELAEFRFLRDIRLPKVIKRIGFYLELVKQIKGEDK